MLPRFWTKSALDCYYINSDCNICKLTEELETIPEHCKMKESLKKLIKEYGRPEEIIGIDEIIKEYN